MPHEDAQEAPGAHKRDHMAHDRAATRMGRRCGTMSQEATRYLMVVWNCLDMAAPWLWNVEGIGSP